MKQVRFVWCFIAISLVCVYSPQAGADPTQILTMIGLGSVHVGMTVAEAEKALGSNLKPFNPKDGVSTEGCWLTERADGTARSVTYMVQFGKIVRIDIWEDEPKGLSVTTEKGIGIGSSEQSVIDKYRSSVEILNHPHMGKDGHYLKIPSEDQQHGMLVETVHGEVVNLRSGDLDKIELIETCL